MDKEKNILSLYKEIKRENENLKEHIKILEEENEVLKKAKNIDWINAKMFKDSIEGAKQIKKEYENARNEIYKLKKEYKDKLNEMMNNY